MNFTIKKKRKEEEETSNSMEEHSSSSRELLPPGMDMDFQDGELPHTGMCRQEFQPTGGSCCRHLGPLPSLSSIKSKEMLCFLSCP